MDFTETKFGQEDELVGDTGYARNKAQLGLVYGIGPWDATWEWTHIADSKVISSSPLFNFDVGAYDVHDIQVAYDFANSGMSESMLGGAAVHRFQQRVRRGRADHPERRSRQHDRNRHGCERLQPGRPHLVPGTQFPVLIESGSTLTEWRAPGPATFLWETASPARKLAPWTSLPKPPEAWRGLCGWTPRRGRGPRERASCARRRGSGRADPDAALLVASAASRSRLTSSCAGSSTALPGNGRPVARPGLRAARTRPPRRGLQAAPERDRRWSHETRPPGSGSARSACTSASQARRRGIPSCARR